MGWHERDAEPLAAVRLPRRRRGYVTGAALAALAAAALIANAALTVVNVRRISGKDAWVVHTHAVREALQSLLVEMQATETRQRRFLITGEPRYLEPYEGNRDAVEHQLARVVELTRDNPSQQEHVEEMRPFVARILALLEQTVQLRTNGTPDPHRTIALMDEGGALMGALQARVGDMLAAENALLVERVRESSVAARNAVVTSVLGLGTSLALLVAAMWALDRRAREVLRAKGSLEAVLRALPDAVLLVDSERRVASMNPTAEELFRRTGRSPPTTVGELVALGTPSARFEEALRRYQPLDRVDLDAALRVEVAGEMRRLVPRTVPLAAESAGGGVILVLLDVTDLARIDEMRSDLVAAASHELRTPVTTLRMSLLMLREGASSLGPRMRDLIDTALVGVNQLLETVDELLDMTRIEAGRLRLSTEPLHVGSIVRAVADRSKARADELGLRVDVQVPDGEPVVVGDHARLRVVIDNVVSNALKYTPRGGRIDISVSSRRDEGSGRASTVEIAVTDTGRGVPEEYRSRVFEKFFRVEHYRPGGENEPRGAGIGLYICKEIVQLHGGTIRCEAAPGRRGTRFVVTLPAVDGSRR